MAQVYLAGPISGLSYEQATNWRENAASILRRRGISSASPMRAKEALRGVQDIWAEGSDLGPFYSAKGIVSRDRFDVRRASLVIMNLSGADAVSVGTMVELGWASERGTPVILVDTPDSVHTHVFVEELVSFVVESVEEACELAIRMLQEV